MTKAAALKIQQQRAIIEKAKADAPKSDKPGLQSVKEPEQTLREVIIKKFPPSSLKQLGYGAYDTLTITAAADWEFEDALNPAAWVNVAPQIARDAANTRRDATGSIVELRTEDHAFYAELYIHGFIYDPLGAVNGLKVQCIGPVIDPATNKAAPINVKTGEVWRGRGK